ILPGGTVERKKMVLLLLCNSVAGGACGYFLIDAWGQDFFWLDYLRMTLTCTALCGAAITDFLRKKIPNILSLVLACGGIVFCLLDFLLRPEEAAGFARSSLIGVLGMAAILGICRLISRGGIGMGDIKILSAMGLVIGLTGSLFTLIYAQILAVLAAVVLLLMRRLQLKDSIPFAPFFPWGFLICMIVGTY
ncbi:MAG: A24 family peptidase, partial [Firmicutes bacterium]|nr:A24 family peptidase [Bacillota bacterium]